MSSSSSSSSAVIINMIVHGAAGRMGSRICALAAEDARFELVGAIERAGAPEIGSLAAAPKNKAFTVRIASSCDGRADVVIDFSSDAGAHAALATALRSSAALLVGTTALSELTVSALRDASSKIPVLVAPNTSLGVPVLARAAADVARALASAGFEISIVEAHHSKKKDAPSGTALRLARAITDTGARIAPDQILAVRGGDVVGEHTIRFAGAGEYIELTHRATSRDVFVHGALRAAAWLAGRAPGWYTIEDVLNLSRK
jgi:4-hydroxy-tetrahydrodipicolinate reductase